MSAISIDRTGSCKVYASLIGLRIQCYLAIINARLQAIIWRWNRKKSKATMFALTFTVKVFNDSLSKAIMVWCNFYCSIAVASIHCCYCCCWNELLKHKRNAAVKHPASACNTVLNRTVVPFSFKENYI